MWLLFDSSHNESSETNGALTAAALYYTSSLLIFVRKFFFSSCHPAHAPPRPPSPPPPTKVRGTISGRPGACYRYCDVPVDLLLQWQELRFAGSVAIATEGQAEIVGCCFAVSRSKLCFYERNGKGFERERGEKTTVLSTNRSILFIVMSSLMLTLKLGASLWNLCSVALFYYLF